MDLAESKSTCLEMSVGTEYVSRSEGGVKEGLGLEFDAELL